METPNSCAASSCDWLIDCLNLLEYPRKKICSGGDGSSSNGALHDLLVGRVVCCECKCHSCNCSSHRTVLLHATANKNTRLVLHIWSYNIYIVLSLIMKLKTLVPPYVQELHYTSQILYPKNLCQIICIH